MEAISKREIPWELRGLDAELWAMETIVDEVARDEKQADRELLKTEKWLERLLRGGWKVKATALFCLSGWAN